MSVRPWAKVVVYMLREDGAPDDIIYTNKDNEVYTQHLVDRGYVLQKATFMSPVAPSTAVVATQMPSPGPASGGTAEDMSSPPASPALPAPGAPAQAQPPAAQLVKVPRKLPGMDAKKLPDAVETGMELGGDVYIGMGYWTKAARESAWEGLPDSMHRNQGNVFNSWMMAYAGLKYGADADVRGKNLSQLKVVGSKYLKGKDQTAFDFVNMHVQSLNAGRLNA